MKKVYVIFGCCGEYSDYREWAVKAYESEEEADKEADRLQELSDKLVKEHRHPEAAYLLDEPKIKELMKDDDPDWITDYTGTGYWYEAIPFYPRNKDA